ncbi:hypothetical protein COL47_22375 [Bacillus toyonensis]|uniref:hypothetical protein n=1 Tax=Bacillus toyonensis TaxID=155322 RepID=UPI000BF8D2D8|nr:hypothetical protein [Bacillus toyonensis]PFY14562.1 hypothetical protein COL47_22375 [Bacillus toyonensis]
MWKVSVSKKYRIYKFTDKFVKELLVWAVRNRGLSTHDQILKSRMSKELRALVNYRRYKDKFKDCMLDLSRCEKIGSVLKNFLIYTSKYHLILQGKVRPPRLLSEKTIEDIEGAFEYLYSSILKSKFFWEIYKPNGVYKSKQEVRREQGKDRVCPYCDQHYINTDIKSNMDHFLPISQFPFLSIHWANLIIGCSICNGILVKNKKWHIPILHPYYDHIDKVIYFSFDRSEGLIRVKVRTRLPNVRKGKIRGEKMIELFKLNESYQELWIEVEDEKNILEYEVERSYGSFKEDLLTDKACAEILETAVGVRKMKLKKIQRKKVFTKLKLDYGEGYIQEEGKEYIEYLRREQQEMFLQREEC